MKITFKYITLSLLAGASLLTSGQRAVGFGYSGYIS